MAVQRPIAITIDPEQIIKAVRAMNRKEREDFLENLLAATSPRYLASIKAARREAKRGRLRTHQSVFGD